MFKVLRRSLKKAFAKFFGPNKGEFQYSLDDFLNGLRQRQNLKNGSSGLLYLFPNLNGSAYFDSSDSKAFIHRTQKLINVLTEVERKEPWLLDASRRVAIAHELGTTTDAVSHFFKQYKVLRDQLKSIWSLSPLQRIRFMLDPMHPPLPLPVDEDQIP